MKRITAMLLLLLTMISLFACAEPEQPAADTTITQSPTDTTAAVAQTTTDPTRDENGYLRDNLPDNLDFANRTFNILYWNDASYEEFDPVMEQSADIIKDALYLRDLTVEQRLKLDLTYEGILGNNSNRTNFYNTVKANIDGGYASYDLIGSYSMTAANLSIGGYAENLLDLEYFDPDMPWWPQSLIDEALINNKLYFASGDISTNLLWNMYLIVFNKDMITEMGKEDPYALALSGEWTLDKLLELATGVYLDNGEAGKNIGDRFGFNTSDIFGDSLFFAAGLNTIERGSDGTPIVSPSYGSEKTYDLLSKLASFFSSNDGNVYPHAVYFGTDENTDFTSGNTLFELRTASFLRNVLAESDVKYGIVPLPKWDTEQENYITTLAFTYTMYTVPIQTVDPKASGAVLEALGSAAYRTTTPAVFDTSLKIKYADDETTSVVFDKIRDGVSFDLGRIYCNSFSNVTYSKFREALLNKQTNWASTYRNFSGPFQKQLEKFLESFQ